WWPKAFGFKLNQFWGKVSFWCWVPGFWVAFAPLYVLGLMGVTRRMRVFDDPSLQIWFVIAAIGAFMIAAGIAAMLIQFAVSIWKREALAETTGDPWDGRTLEWATSSPPPAYNFAFTPRIHALDAWYDMKGAGVEHPADGYKDIHMPSNTGAGVILAAISTVCGFALVWHIWWLAGLSFIALIATAIAHTFNYRRDYHIPAAEVAATEAARMRQLEAAKA
ncbi:cbb3-type cytochrome c oxidase subunit I, partial [Blastomonas sp.]|uniref:cbb3-type cytochrome c oxidase subunit I n=1 Tax=Blastomonas sp. TaxID=1909299 RepID=UPI00262F9D39